jgi:Ca2+-binding EF-hand superfamily protein
MRGVEEELERLDLSKSGWILARDLDGLLHLRNLQANGQHIHDTVCAFNRHGNGRVLRKELCQVIGELFHSVLYALKRLSTSSQTELAEALGSTRENKAEIRKALQNLKLKVPKQALEKLIEKFEGIDPDQTVQTDQLCKTVIEFSRTVTSGGDAKRRLALILHRNEDGPLEGLLSRLDDGSGFICSTELMRSLEYLELKMQHSALEDCMRQFIVNGKIEVQRLLAALKAVEIVKPLIPQERPIITPEAKVPVHEENKRRCLSGCKRCAVQ